ncbi:unnamed protein product [Rotaria magnacalcarata]|uniref:Uncharacterized protein n=2 Tax=Rotaria magnacalcarata TaxID=392030 RepID=A0A816MT12_9BILA|nr:unnamed protein product [Rotaria magnacalcarata]
MMARCGSHISAEPQDLITYSDLNVSIGADDRIRSLQESTSNLLPALLENETQRESDPRQQRHTLIANYNRRLLNIFSLCVMEAGKFPDEWTLQSYTGLQSWMYLHSNQHSVQQLCEALQRICLTHDYNHKQKIVFNIQVITAEASHAVGANQLALCIYDQAQTLSNKDLNRSDDTTNSVTDLERQQIAKKLKDLGKKLEFSARFQAEIISRQRNLRELQAVNEEESRHIWRQIVLNVARVLDSALESAEQLFKYAYSLPQNSLQCANMLYVALNIYLLAKGRHSFDDPRRLDVFKLLNDIAADFELYGDQSKQFSPLHKMAHVWGTAAVAYYLHKKKHEYELCSSVMRVTFETFGIYFLSSGIESLCLLAREHAPEFCDMMANSPNVKVRNPDCIYHVRRRFRDVNTCIPFSTDEVERMVAEFINIDASTNSE